MDKPLIIFYDNWCPNCTRFTNIIKKLDWFTKITEVPLRDLPLQHTYTDLDLNMAYQQMAGYNRKWHYGFSTIYLILIRLPLFWPFIPFFFLIKISTIGQIFYKELAIKRKILPIHCTTESCTISDH